jgi:hypothetical protein
MTPSRFAASAFLTLALVAGGGAVAHADSAVGGTGSNSSVGGTGGAGLHNPLQFATLPQLLNAILDFVITIGGIVIVVMIVFIGFKFVAAQGNSEKLQEARTMLLWTVIGALILLGAKAIETGIQATVQSLS